MALAEAGASLRRAVLPESGRAPVDFRLAWERELGRKQRSESAQVREEGLEKRTEPAWKQAQVWERVPERRMGPTQVPELGPKHRT